MSQRTEALWYPRQRGVEHMQEDVGHDEAALLFMDLDEQGDGDEEEEDEEGEEREEEEEEEEEEDEGRTTVGDIDLDQDHDQDQDQDHDDLDRDLDEPDLEPGTIRYYYGQQDFPYSFSGAGSPYATSDDFFEGAPEDLDQDIDLDADIRTDNSLDMASNADQDEDLYSPVASP
ncbi:hypothetical protein BGZ65_012818 [Modicella reniformis]|uniref:Uncharacterized protein n=1 Tax=Modicella reniformis TaxID=1440133 RepID=A0A9P6MJP6_9FUNG|nr:hypothetical protein BGZ65_012818 [Modicella reniformis]